MAAEAMKRMELHGQSAFVPVMIDDAHFSHSGQSVPALSGDSEIGIDLCGLTLRIPEGASANHIGRVLQAVVGTS
jgi:hypothetical protein